MRINRVRAACLTVALGLANSGSALGGPNTTAVFGLYASNASAGPKVNSALAEKLGCNVLRTGKIVAQDGDIGLPKPDAFVMLTCPKPVLSDSGASLDQLVSNAKRIALFEGNLVVPPKREVGNKVGDRQYVVKVSMFNNRNPDVRRRNLVEIDELVAKRQDRYYPEATIEVGEALGARRADEVVMLYYDDLKAGDRFRASNPDIMGRIGKFNSEHVERFVYYVGIAQE